MNAPKRPFILILALLPCLRSSHAAAQTWRKVDSRHSRVVTDGSDRDGRTVAKEFEQMRSLFAARFHDANLETGAPLLIVAVRESGLRALAPLFWKNRNQFAGMILSLAQAHLAGGR